MSSFGSSAINKSGKKPVPKAARRRPGAAESQPLSQPATPALSAVSIASNDEPQLAPLPARTPVDESQHLANNTSQAARDGAEVRLQHRSEELGRQQERDGLVSDGTTLRSTEAVTEENLRAFTENGSSRIASTDAGVLGDRRVQMSRRSAGEGDVAANAPQLEQPHVQQQLLEGTNRILRHESFAESASSGTPNVAANEATGAGLASPSTDDRAAEASSATQVATANKRKRAAGIKDFPYKRPKHLQTSGEITLESLEAEVQPSIEDNTPEAQPTKKPRKVRKDKGIPRGKKTEPSQAGGTGALDATPAPRSTSTRELRRRPSATSQETIERQATELTGTGEERPEEGPEEGEVKRRKRAKRKSTPEGNEAIEINPAEACMADMLVDKKTGKVSTLERRMREIDWAEVNRKRKAARMPPEGNEHTQLGGATQGGDQEVEHASRNASHDDEAGAGMDTGAVRQRTRMVNGVITVVDEAQHVDRHAEGDAEMETLEVVEHEDLTERITSKSWIDTNRRDPVERKYGRRKADPWNLRDTDKFYEALRMFGTDFFVIAKMFHGKTRRQVKMKFVREEHDDPDRVKRALHGERKLLDIEAFKAVTGITHFKSPEEILLGLEEDRRTREEEIVRAREEFDEEQRQKKFLEASGAGAGGENGESAKENEAPGARSKKKTKAKNKLARGPVATADQAAEIVETVDE